MCYRDDGVLSTPLTSEHASVCELKNDNCPQMFKDGFTENNEMVGVDKIRK